MKTIFIRIFMTLACTFLILAILRMCLLSYDDYDAIWKRKYFARHVKRLAASAKEDSSPHSTHMLKIVKIAKGKYGFGAVHAVGAMGELGELSRPYTTDLCDLLKSNDIFVRRETAVAISRLGVVAADCFDCTLEAFLKGEPARGSTLFCAEALGNMGYPADKVAPALESRLGESEYLDEVIHEVLKKLNSMQSK